MKTKEEIQSLIEMAKDLGLPSVEVDGVKFNLATATPRPAHISEAKAEDLVTPMSVLEDLTDEEILFWSSPYGLELEEQRNNQTKKSEEQL